MKKVIVVFTKSTSLKSIGIKQQIPVFPQKIIINESLSIYLFSDAEEKPNLDFINNQFDEFYIIYHGGGTTDKGYVANAFGDRLKGSRTFSHIKGSFYDRQLREVLEHVVADNDNASSPWKIREGESVDEDFLLKPFNDDGLEAKMILLYKLLLGNFEHLNNGEKELLSENDFDLDNFKRSFNPDNPDWDSFKQLRDSLTSKLTLNL